MRVLSREDVRSLVPMAKAVELVKLAFADLSAGRALSPMRTSLEVPRGPGTTLVMPAYVPSVAALGLKVVSVFTGNAARGLPTIMSLVTLLDDQTGQPIAIMDGAYLTALRTGAVSGAASDFLARDDARVLTVIGAGAQALTQVAAVCAVRPIERVIVAARSEAGLTNFQGRIREEWPELSERVEVTQDVSAAVRLADIICTATTSRTPVFDDADVRPGTHINGVGSFTPEMQEVPSQTVARAVVVVDQLEPALEEAGDLIVPLRKGIIDASHITRELGKLVTSEVPGRVSSDDVTFFKSVGNAVQDMAVGRFAFEQAVRGDVGQIVQL